MKKNKLFPIILTTVLMATPFTALAATEKLSVDKETADYVTINSDGSQYFVFAVKKEAVANTEEHAQASEVQQNDAAVQITSRQWQYRILKQPDLPLLRNPIKVLVKMCKTRSNKHLGKL